MRTDLVSALKKNQQHHSPFVLCRAVTKVARKIHNPVRARIQESVNDAFTAVTQDPSPIVFPGWDIDSFNGITGEGQYSFVTTPDEFAN